MASLPQRPMLADLLVGRDNNLNLIRVLAASAVLFSHAFPIALGRGAIEPLDDVAGVSLGWLAVAVFFSLSGLLIANSFERRSSWVQFVAARVLRLFPALLVVLILTVLAGLYFTTLNAPEYLRSPETWAYIPRNLSLAFLQYPLPGVFQDNPYPEAINGSLWTLFYEVSCYTLLFLAGVLGILRSKWMVTVFVVMIGAAFIWCFQSEPPAGGIAVRLYLLITLGFPFSLGVLVYVWREKFTFDWRVLALLWVVCAAGLGTPFTTFFFVIALTYSVGWFGFVPKGRLLSYNKLGDYSYGIYIYAFPVQQAVSHAFAPVSPVSNIALSIVPTFVLAILSWHIVEKRALARVKPLAALFQPGALNKAKSDLGVSSK